MIRSGEYVGKVYGDFTEEGIKTVFIRKHPASGISLVCWRMGFNASARSDGGTQYCWVEVSFRDVNDTVLALYRSQVLNAVNVSPAGWVELSVNQKIDPVS